MKLTFFLLSAFLLITISCKEAVIVTPVCEFEKIQQDSLEWQIKKHVVDKFAPGQCFGMPNPVPPGGIRSYLLQYPELAARVAAAYNLSDSSRIYEKVKMFNAISLADSGCSYGVSFRSGNCCEIREYSGRVLHCDSGLCDDIEVRNSYFVPC